MDVDEDTDVLMHVIEHQELHIHTLDTFLNRYRLYLVHIESTTRLECHKPKMPQCDNGPKPPFQVIIPSLSNFVGPATIREQPIRSHRSHLLLTLDNELLVDVIA